MVIQALQKTNNRSIEAAVEFISKMSYQDPRREQMAAAAARPINASMKPGDSSYRLFGFFFISSFTIYCKTPEYVKS